MCRSRSSGVSAHERMARSCCLCASRALRKSLVGAPHRASLLQSARRQSAARVRTWSTREQQERGGSRAASFAQAGPWCAGHAHPHAAACPRALHEALLSRTHAVGGARAARHGARVKSSDEQTETSYTPAPGSRTCSPAPKVVMRPAVSRNCSGGNANSQRELTRG
eukprot:3595929-Prymnesium_polylepis.1